jgi:hypothetical protein
VVVRLLCDPKTWQVGIRQLLRRGVYPYGGEDPGGRFTASRDLGHEPQGRARQVHGAPMEATELEEQSMSWPSDQIKRELDEFC